MVEEHKELVDLAYFIDKLSYDKLPDSVKEAAKLCIIDTLGVGIAATKYPLIKSICNEFNQIVAKEKQSNVVGTDYHFNYIYAAFNSAMASHFLELDDVHTRSKAHIGTVVVPTAWSMGMGLGLPGKKVLEGVVCGYEVMARIGMGFGVTSHRNKGWHVTGTAGTFGSAAVASKLLKLTDKQTVSALGLAGTQSANLWSFLEDGTTNKILHPGHAALAGINAALLAKAGMTGPEHVLSAKDGGLFPAMSNEYDYSMVTKNLGEEYEILKMDRKPYPCCRSTHPSLYGVLEIMNESNVDFHKVQSIEIKTYEVGYKQCGKSKTSLNPKTSSEAKFSTPYTVACALVSGKVDLESFNETHLNNPDIKELIKKVKVVPDPYFSKKYPEHWGSAIKIETDENVYEKKITDAYGSVSNPMSPKDVLQRSVTMVKGKVNEEKLKNLEDIRNLEKWEKLKEI